MNWLRLLAGYPVYITLIPILGFRRGTPRDRMGIAAEVLATVALAVVVVKLAPFAWILHGWLLPMLFVKYDGEHPWNESAHAAGAPP